MEKLPSDLISIPGFEPLTSDDTNDWKIDQLLSQIPDPVSVCPQIPYIPGSPPPGPSSKCSPQASRSSRFAKPVSDEEIQDLKKQAIPANTQKSTSFAVNVWKEWSSHRKAVNPSNWPAHLLIMNECELNRWLSRSVYTQTYDLMEKRK